MRYCRAMAAPNPQYNVLDDSLFEAGGYLFVEDFEEQVLENLQHLLLEHDHDGTAGNGGAIPASNPVYLWYIGAAASS